MYRRIIPLLLLSCIALTGCSSSSVKNSIDIEALKEKYETITIGVSLLHLQHKFSQDLKEGLEKAASECNINIIVKDSMMDLGKQVSDINSFIESGVNGIILSPVDSKGVVDIINKAKAAHIYVVTLDIAADGVEVDSNISSDNIMGGRLAGKYAVKLLNKKGNVAIIDHHVVNSVVDRVKGFEDEIAKYPDIKVVAKKDAGGVRDKASVVAGELLQAHHDIDLIFAINDDTCIGVLSTFNGMEEAKNIKVVSYDATPWQQEKILQDSMLKVSIIQFPKEMGRTALITILRLLDGQQVDKEIRTRVGVFDKKGIR